MISTKIITFIRSIICLQDITHITGTYDQKADEHGTSSDHWQPKTQKNTLDKT